jgi:hypothetical protein
VAIHEFEGAVLSADAGEGDVGAGGGVSGERRRAVLLRVFPELMAHGGALHTCETHLSPFGDGHGFDESEFVRRDGEKCAFEVGDEFPEEFT